MLLNGCEQPSLSPGLARSAISRARQRCACFAGSLVPCRHPRLLHPTYTTVRLTGCPSLLLRPLFRSVAMEAREGNPHKNYVLGLVVAKMPLRPGRAVSRNISGSAAEEQPSAISTNGAVSAGAGRDSMQIRLAAGTGPHLTQGFAHRRRPGRPRRQRRQCRHVGWGHQACVLILKNIDRLRLRCCSCPCPVLHYACALSSSCDPSMFAGANSANGNGGNAGTLVLRFQRFSAGSALLMDGRAGLGGKQTGRGVAGKGHGGS